MLTETRCTDDVNIFRLPLYNTFYLNRPTGRGGGVCILIRKSIECEILNEFSTVTQDYELLTINLHNTVFSVCYRPPSDYITHFLEYLDTFLAFTNDTKLDIIFGGDININIMKNDSPKLRLEMLLKCNACWNTIILPTRVTKNTSSLIDVFITNINPDSVKAGVFVSDFSDPIPIFLCYKGHLQNKESQSTHLTQPITEQNIFMFRTKIVQTAWNTVFESKDANDAYEAFFSLLKPIYDACFPFKCVK